MTKTGLLVLALPPGHESRLADTGWSSSSSPVFDFRATGNAFPMYAVFAIAVVLLMVGMSRYLRSQGISLRAAPTGADRNATRRFGRLVEFGLLQRRTLGRRVSGWTHLPIFWGFVVLTLGSLAIMVDTYVLGPLGLAADRGLAYKVFQASLDLFGLGFVAGVGLAILRRTRTEPGKARHDRFLLVLFVLLGIGVSGFVLEGLRIRLEGSAEPWAFVGSAVAGLLTPVPLSPEQGAVLYWILWWSHVVAAFSLLAALPYLPLRHAFTAPLNMLFSSGLPSGRMTAPFNLKEVMRSGRFDVKAGANNIGDFFWESRLGLTACVNFGGCEDVCPAHASGTALSPMRLLAALQLAAETDRAAELIDGSDAEDAIWSCTLCGACTGSCPTVVDPMDYVVQLRRGLVAKSRLGKQRTALLANLSYARNPYGSNGSARADQATALGLVATSERSDADMIYWIGCAATFDPRAQKVAQATVEILQRAGIRCAVLGPEESCCGDPARRVGEEGLFQDLVSKNIETIERHGAKTVLTHCAHCFNTLRNEYPEFGARFEVVHHATLIRDLIAAGKIEPAQVSTERATFHDACYMGRFNRSVEPPRTVLHAVPGTTLQEMARSGERGSCCGAGGANYWYEVPRREKIGSARVREAAATGAQILVTECPFCLKMLEDAVVAESVASLRVRDIAEVVADSLRGARGT